MRDLIDEVKKTGWNVDYFAAHDLEELSEEKTGLHDKVDRGDLFSAVVVALAHQELLHLDVVVLAEQLQETEDSAESQLVIELGVYLELVCLVAEHLD